MDKDAWTTPAQGWYLHANAEESQGGHRPRGDRTGDARKAGSWIGD
jgi:hypothetical protein